MVYKITNMMHAIGAGIENPYLIKAVGNPLFPLVAISLLFIIILTAITYKSNMGWKLFSIAAILTLSSVAGILFLNKYMANKSNPSRSYSGGNTDVRLPDTSFFNVSHTSTQPVTGASNELPVPSFDDLFGNM
jgi:hypothetical protein